VVCANISDFSDRVILVMTYFAVLTLFPFRRIITNNDTVIIILYVNFIYCVALVVCLCANGNEVVSMICVFCV
jgi:hypothetical protein